MFSSTSRSVAFVIVLVVLVHAIILYSIPLLPFIDLPNHLAEATVYKYATPGSLLGQYYKAVPWYYPNTFHPVFCSLFPSIEVGNKTFHVFYIALLLSGIFLIIKELRGNLWYGLLTVLFIYSYNVAFGFVGYGIAIPATFWFFYLVLLDLRTEKLLYKVLAALSLCVIFLMHAQMGMFGILLYGAIMLYRHWKNLKLFFVKSILVCLPVVLMMFMWWLTRAAAKPGEKSTFSYLVRYYKTSFFQDFYKRGRIIFFDNYALRDGAAGLLIATFFFALLFLPLLYYKVWKQRTKNDGLKDQLVYPVIFLIVTSACYLLLPNELPGGQTPLYERFTTVILLIVIIIGSVLLRQVRTRAMALYVIAAGILYTGLWAEYFYDFNKKNNDFTPALFAGMQPDSKLAGLIYDYKYRGRIIYMHYPNYYIVWKKGLAATKMIDYRFNVVVRGEKGEEIPFYHGWIGRDYEYRKQYVNTINYFLVRGNAPAQPDSNLLNATLVRQAGPWKLYKNNQLP